MRADILPIPGVVLGAYPERRADARRAGANPFAHVPAWTGRGRRIGRYETFVERVFARDAALGAIAAAEPGERLIALRAAMARHGFREDLVTEAFVLVKRACARELGFALYPAQVLAARAMLDGKLAEMATGEGKTLAAALCAATAALAGIPVHVVTANDYLVARDAQSLRPLYEALGLRVAYVTQALDLQARRRAYDCDIVYCTAPELVFDYLRDTLVRERGRSDLEQRVAQFGATASTRRTLLRGLCMAVIDEADSVLIDDARVPFILSEPCVNEGERRYFAEALRVARALDRSTDFVLDTDKRSAALTAAGRARLERCARSGQWLSHRHAEETVCVALAALHLFQRDRQYLVRDGAVTIIDESTGRLAPGRVWSRGLHRLIEMKENCEPAADTTTVASITYQRFFQRYFALAGMSGTLTEARAELGAVYGLAIVKVPLTHPSRRVVLPTRLYATSETMWQAAVAEALEVSAGGRPVLIGTDSVLESDALSRRLAAAGAPHAVLNARQDRDEAQIVAQAGEPGRITVATNMAGRGTDIALGAGVAQAGGLHVICCQHNAARRIDRQLLGRCARRGDPGSARTLIALDKPLIAPLVPQWLRRAAGIEHPQWLVKFAARAPQWLAEQRARRERRALMRDEARRSRELFFARPKE